MSQEITPKLHQRFANIGSQICNSSNICPAQLRKQCLKHNPADEFVTKTLTRMLQKGILKNNQQSSPDPKQC